MRRRALIIVWTTLALGAAASAQRGSSEPSRLSTSTRAPRNADEFDVLFKQVSNWGRWGKDDQLGAMNLVTQDKRVQALGLARIGEAVSLAHVPLTETAVDNPSPFEHTMNEGFQTDTYKVNYHGLAHSHIDALCHFAYKDQTYNGYARAQVNTASGCTKLGIENLKNGVVTRAVLMDIPRLKDLPYLEPGTPVFAEDLNAWEKKTGVRVTPGDALLLRTGRWARRAKVGPWDLAENAAGFHASVAQWLKDRGVALIGSDAVLDVNPQGVEGVFAPVHVLVVAALGINILDSQDLEAVADTAARLNRWEFMLVVAPLPVKGGTGFPLSVLAIF